MERNMAKTLFLILLSFSAFATEDKLWPMETDYCTLYPEGTRYRPELWKHCCLQHDLFFWAGGTRQDQLEDNYRFRDCVSKVSGYAHGKIVYLAITAAQYSPYKIPEKKYNNGWRSRSPYQRLSVQDIDRIEDHILNGDYAFIPDWMKFDFVKTLRQRPTP
jgi:hypothetical protein